jgi:molecular chaperone DnaK (HSP70)
MNVGIDLGTSYSLIAIAQGSEPLVVPDSQDPEFVETPSSVYISPDSAFVGRRADRMESENPALLRRAFKRRFGDTQALLRAQGQDWFPETLAALLLTKLVRDATRVRPEDVEAAVITVPVHFDDAQRKAVLNAAHLAKLEVLALFDEPTAAALHYRMQAEARRQTLLVYDFGGGTFDVSVLTLDHGELVGCAKTGVTELGGKDLDTRLRALILAQYGQALGQPVAAEDLSLPIG